MTYRELYLKAKSVFSARDIDSPGEDSLALVKAFFGLDRSALALRGQECPAPERERDFLKAVEERAARRPLQYILGEWEFMGLSLRVGEGVLVPREDTAVLAETLAERLQGVPEPVGVDLCAGSGAVALGLCTLLPHAKLTCLELSEQAFSYLEQNLAAYPQYKICAKVGDVLRKETAESFPPQSLDFIASNPPYIPSKELSILQPEVQREPAMALDGGEDGLVFYRALCALWLPRLKPGGVLAVEIGEDQGKAVSALFASHGLTKIELRQDWAGLDRCVAGEAG
ncbi:peptide chain release factor N(5)-glutamine methyltransferase [Neglectibacter caecimuris]|uniref:peptide chain release factor N(5)-glutamine methyltransferase n=1 Tax=Neglectibacter caecimuris TaxID=3093658 RepID=UPI002AC91878|nr:peptide chain release factor N(5)-glutamine methyltransferase [Neglectibacter sp. M00184]